MRPLRIALSVSALALLLAGSPAEARPASHGARTRSSSSNVALGLGADYLVDPEVGEFQLTLAVETPIARGVTAGARFGALMTSDPTKVGAPIDFRLRLRTRGLYLDGLIGPWLVFDSGDTLRFHGGVGFGLLTGRMSLGLEVGFLDRSGMIGLRLAFSL
jgi:hypothetical protein